MSVVSLLAYRVSEVVSGWLHFFVCVSGLSLVTCLHIIVVCVRSFHEKPCKAAVSFVCCSMQLTSD